MHGARELQVSAAPGWHTDWVGAFLPSSILGAVLVLRGEAPLHASAVHWRGNTLAFLGGSGAGKSTLAALYCLAGGELVTDDLLIVTKEGLALPGVQEIRLRSAAHGLADKFARRRVRKTVDGRWAINLIQRNARPTRLSALVMPSLVDGPAAIGVTRLHGATAFKALAAVPRMLGVVDLALQGNFFRHFAVLADRIPVFEARIPRGQLRDAGLAAELFEAIWRQ
jgi:serine kinase of HPr protein (carbohydrate metabolism regulator)